MTLLETSGAPLVKLVPLFKYVVVSGVFPLPARPPNKKVEVHYQRPTPVLSCCYRSWPSIFHPRRIRIDRGSPPQKSQWAIPALDGPTLKENALPARASRSSRTDANGISSRLIWAMESVLTLAWAKHAAQSQTMTAGMKSRRALDWRRAPMWSPLCLIGAAPTTLFGVGFTRVVLVVRRFQSAMVRCR